MELIICFLWFLVERSGRCPNSVVTEQSRSD